MVFSADGRSVLTATAGQVISRWDAATGRLMDEKRLDGPLAPSCWFSPDGRFLAGAGPDDIAVWDVAKRERVRKLAGHFRRADFCADGRIVVLLERDAMKGGLRLWDLRSGEAPKLVVADIQHARALLSPDSRRVFETRGAAREMICFDVGSGRKLWTANGNLLALSADGRRVLTSCEGAYALLEAQSGEVAHKVTSQERSAREYLLAPSAAWLAVLGDEVYLYDLERVKCTQLPVRAGCAAFSPDGRSLVTLGPHLQRWDLATGKPLWHDRHGDGHIGPILALAWAPDGRSLLSHGDDGTLRLWDRRGRQRLLRTDANVLGPPCSASGEHFGDREICLKAVPSGPEVVFEHVKGGLQLYDVAADRVVQYFALPHTREVYNKLAAARLTADGRTLLAVVQQERREGDGRFPCWPVIAWDVRTGKELYRWAPPRKELRPEDYSLPGWCAFSPDGRFLAVANADRPYDLSTDQQLPAWVPERDYTHPLLFSPDGRFFAFVVDGKAVEVWDLLTWRPLMRREADLACCTAMDFGPDGRTLAVAAGDTLYVWDTVTGRELLRLASEGRLPGWTTAGFATTVAIAPDGGTIATGHADSCIYLWGLPAVKPAARAGALRPEAAWEDLGAADPRKAWAAIDALAGEPKTAVTLLRSKVRAVEVDPRRLRALLDALDVEGFEERQGATRALMDMVEIARPQLDRALAEAKSPEVIRRLRQVLATRPPLVPPGSERRSLRAVAVLEQVGSDEARSLLGKLAAGEPMARLTREARAALDRLARASQR